MMCNCHCGMLFMIVYIKCLLLIILMGRRRRDRMVVGLLTTYAISAYHH